MTDEESPTESQPAEPKSVEPSAEPTDQPTQSQPTDHDDEGPTELIGHVQAGPGSRARTIKRTAIVVGAIVLVAALAFTLTQIIRKDPPPAVEEAAAAEVFLQAANTVGDSPFAPESVATAQPAPTNPGSDPLGPPPAAPAPPPDGQAAPMVLRTANGDLPGLYGGTLDTTTCDAELMINYLGENPNKARAWAAVHRISPDQIRAYVSELTPVLLRTDTRLTDHGYIEVGQSIPRQAVLQAGTAVLVDKYGSPRVRCISGSPLLDPVAITAPVVRPAGNVVVQPAAVPARPRVIFVGPRWPRFDPVTIVVIRRVIRIIDYFFLWDFRRGVLLARAIGIIIRDIANLLDPRLRGIVPLNLLPRPVPARPPVQVPLPLQPPRILPQRPPVQQQPPQGPPVQQAPAPIPAAPPAQAPAPLPQQPLPQILDTWDPPIYNPPPVYNPTPRIVDTWDPPVWDPPVTEMPGGHTPSVTGLTPGGGMPEHTPPVTGGTTSGGGTIPAEIPSSTGGGVPVPAITGGCSNPAYPCLPAAPSGGGHSTAPIQDAPADVPAADPIPQQIPQHTGTGGYTPPNYGSLPGAGDSGGDPGGNLQCDALLNPC
jgi:hypothetical protein